MGDNATSLDGFHVVFGEILEGIEVIEAISKIDRYTYTTKTGYTGLKPKGKTKSTDDLADKWFEAQREFYGKKFSQICTSSQACASTLPISNLVHHY